MPSLSVKWLRTSGARKHLALGHVADNALEEFVLTAARQGNSSTHLLHQVQEAKEGRVLHHQLADERSAVGGVLCSQNTSGQDAVREKGVHCFFVDDVCQQMGSPVSEQPDAGLSAILHLHLLLFQESDLILQRPVQCSCASLCPQGSSCTEFLDLEAVH